MKRLTAAFALAAALGAVAVGAAPRNWNATVTTTEAGSHVLGNPEAEVKLTEYVSYTCSHCANFEKNAESALRVGYVASGKVSVEVRHIVRDPIDLTAAMLTHCGPPAKFFANHTAFLRSQDRWIARQNTAGPLQRERWEKGPLPQRTRAIATDFGFYDIMRGRGYERAAVDRCLANEAMARRLAAMSAEAGEEGVRGTPSFKINGSLLSGTHDWRSLEPQINARL
jgi:protein-disulfide isomerase